MKGIILAGGNGTRLFPITKTTSKQLVNLYDKPLIYYPLSVLIGAGIKNILIICKEQDLNSYKRLFNFSIELGINIEYEIQNEPKGIAEAFIIGEKFIGDDDVCLMLGDNFLYGDGLYNFLAKIIEKFDSPNPSAEIIGYPVKNPKNFGIIELKDNKIINITEKPKNPKSNLAVIGLYFYPNSAISYSKKLIPSKRGEIEITSLNETYLKNNNLNINILGRGYTWLDTGTFDDLLNASLFVKMIEERSGLKIGCVEETSFKRNFTDKTKLKNLIKNYPDSDYKEYLKNLIND